MDDSINFPLILDQFPEYEFEGVKTGVVGLMFSNKIQLILNEAEIFGSIIHVSTDNAGIIYDVKVLMGERNEISQLYARRLLELFRNKGHAKNDLILLTSIRKYSIEHLRGILKHLDDHLTN